MYHINKVVEIAKQHSLSSDEIVACYLHDTLEDTKLKYHEIRDKFWIDVAEMVYAVTDEVWRNRNERKAKTIAKLKEMRTWIAIKLCDRIANIQFSRENSEPKYQMYLREHAEFTELDRKWENTSLWELYYKIIKWEKT